MQGAPHLLRRLGVSHHGRVNPDEGHTVARVSEAADTGNTNNIHKVHTRLPHSEHMQPGEIIRPCHRLRYTTTCLSTAACTMTVNGSRPEAASLKYSSTRSGFPPYTTAISLERAYASTCTDGQRKGETHLKLKPATRRQQGWSGPFRTTQHNTTQHNKGPISTWVFGGPKPSLPLAIMTADRSSRAMDLNDSSSGSHTGRSNPESPSDRDVGSSEATVASHDPSHDPTPAATTQQTMQNARHNACHACLTPARAPHDVALPQSVALPPATGSVSPSKSEASSS